MRMFHRPISPPLVLAVSIALACGGTDDRADSTEARGSAICAPLSGYRIAFTADRDGGYDIYVVNADGSNETRLTDWAGSEFGPRWSPDGTHIAFNADRAGGFDIWTIEVDGSSVNRVTTLPGGEWDPDWSPDGRTLLFTYDDGNTRDVMAVDWVDGTVRNLTHSSWDDYGPVFSPDGSMIAFLSNRHGLDGMNNEIYVMASDGSNARRLTENLVRESILDWYPDGVRLAWTKHPWGASQDELTDGNDEIYTGDINGGPPSNLTDHPATDEHVNISPDGCWLVFDSDRRGGQSELFISPLDGFDARLVGSGVTGLWSSISRVPEIR